MSKKGFPNIPLPCIPQTLSPLPQALPPLHPSLSSMPQNMPSSNNSIENSPVTTTIMVNTKFGRYPIVMNCPFCKTVTITSVKKVHPCLDFFCCFCCCCGLKCKKRNHYCSKCNKYLGVCDK